MAELLRLISSGIKYKEIATYFGVTERTIQKYANYVGRRRGLSQQEIDRYLSVGYFLGEEKNGV